VLLPSRRCVSDPKAAPCGTLWESTLCSASKQKTLGRRANMSTTPAVMRCTTLAGSCSRMSMAATNPKHDHTLAK
jgi:hypothetical protein